MPFKFPLNHEFWHQEKDKKIQNKVLFIFKKLFIYGF